MMLTITCDSCGETYRVDSAKIKGERARVKCKRCQNTILVLKPKPDDEGAVESMPPFGGHDEVSSSGAAAKAETAPGEKLSFESKKVRFGLAFKVIILMLIVSLVPLAIFGGMTFREGAKRIEADTEVQMAQIAQGLAIQVEEWLDKNVRVLNAAARLPEIVSMDRARQEPVLKVIGQEYPWTYLVFTVGLDGMNVARNDDKSLINYADRSYYKDVVAGKPVAWQTLISRTNNKPALVVSVPIKSGEKIVGVMAAGMTIDDISKNVATWKRGNTGFAFMVDEKGKVVAHQLNQYVVSEKNLSSHPLVSAFKQKKEPITLNFVNEEGRASLGHVRGNTYGWALAVQQENDDVFETLRRLQFLALLLLGLTVILVILIAWVSARRVTKPIMTLTKAAEQMSLGNLELKIDIRSKDEIGLLAQAITRMQTSLRMALDRLRQRL
jgi:methyl-accepting chemotaxis protein